MDIEYGNKEEREKYKKRIRRQNTAIENLLGIASQHPRLFSRDMIHALGERKEECERLYHKLDKNEFEIAIVGLEKAGKSTFANALIGNHILPDADERCTYTSTCIKFGSDKARVKFFTKQEFDINFREKLSSMEFENTEQYSIETLSLAQYRKMFATLDAGRQRLYETNINEDIVNILKNRENLLRLYLGQAEKTFENDELKTDEFKKYIVSPSVAIAVKEVLIESSELKEMPNAIIYDVPGFDSPTQMHEDQTIDKMKKADVIILIASAEKPSFTAPALKVFHKVVDQDNIELSDKLFLFGNRADAANTLEKNYQTLRDEARERNLLRGEYLDDRLFIGSAKAHLQQIGQEKGDSCIRKLEEMKKKYGRLLEHGDGIRYTYEKLVEYNMTDRFRLLKGKVDKNDQKIQKIFEQLRNEYRGNDNAVTDAKELIQIGNKLCIQSRAALVQGLEELRGIIRDQYNTKAALSIKMQKELAELFESSRYFITEEDINRAKLKVGGTTSSINAEKVEEMIREKKFKEIYGELSEMVLKIAAKDHEDSYDKIYDLFETTLQVNKHSPDYELLRQRLESYIQRHKKRAEDADNYQALIERFIRDLVEVLVMRPYGLEARLNRFLDDSSTFSGLIMFYDPGDAGTDYKKSFMAIAPKDQPLLYALLFHEYKDSIQTSREILDYISSIAEDARHSLVVLELICSMIKKNPQEALDTVKEYVTEQEFEDYDEDDRTKELIPKLRTTLNKIPKMQRGEMTATLKEYDFTDESRFKIQYQQYFVRKDLRKYEDIQKEYATDLEILKDFLISASIPAISIEKPFIAKEVKSIDGLIDSIESDSYLDFITDNLELLRKESFDEFERKQSEHMVNRAVVREIEHVLADMSKDS